MENKRSIFKSIFYIFFALLLLSGGLAMFQTPVRQTSAEDTTSEEIENVNIPQYFSVEEWQIDTAGAAPEKVENSLTQSNTFLHYVEGPTQNYLKLSLLQNGSSVNTETTHDIYARVYYPNPADLSTFYFYSINSINLYINGTKQSINMGDFVVKSGLSFANKSEVQLDGFEMYFIHDKSESISGVDPARQISILDDSGEVKEGSYTVSVTYGLFLCTDGGISATEEKFSDESLTLNYNFYVLDRDNFLENNNPKIKRENFDKEVPITELTNRNYAYYLYSNYSSEPTDTKTTPYRAPYIEYDYTRFEATISKELSENTTTQKLVLDKDAYLDNVENADSELSPIISTGDSIIKTKLDKTNHTVKVFFYDVGNYNITFNAIKLANFEVSKESFEFKKYNLSGLTGVTKKVNVYMYGYQANYTDIDKPANEYNVRPVSELKTLNKTRETFEQSADITSGFLNSNPYHPTTNPAGYSQTTASTTFLIDNVLGYINSNTFPPVKTDQTPIKFTANATLASGTTSYIYSTARPNDSYTEYTGGKLGTGASEETLYRTKFTGLTDNAAGKYIYIIAYTFNNYYSAETTLAASTTFYQVFYFEIQKELPTIEIVTTNDAGTPVFVSNGKFINKDITITDTTDTNIENSYKKDVTIQIYAQDFSGGYLAGFGDDYGISFKELTTEKELVLKENAHYTIRLYFTSEMTTLNTALSSKTGYFREQTFTIDKIQVENITARNFVEITNSTNYKYYSTLSTEQFSTNQSIALSWSEKASTAKTYAYYRYFPLVSTNYYSKLTSKASSTIEKMLNYSSEKHYLPLNYVIDMETSDNQWLEYKGNTWGSEEIASDYIFSDEGLYLIDVYDEAGNHSIEVFVIDKTTPIFSIYDENGYSLVSSSVFITKPCSLYWGNYKTIYLANINTLPYNSRYTADNIDDYAGELTHDLYKLKTGKTNTDIFKKIYNKLYKKDYLEHLTNSTQINPATDGLVEKYFDSSYSGYYLTIPINNRTYYIDQNHPSYTSKEGSDNWKQPLTIAEEMTYRVLLRDLSNTKYDQTIPDPNNLLHYTGYYSAYQTIIVSFDDSEFFVEYQNAGQTTPLSSNTVVIDSVTDPDGNEHSKKTTYLSPTKMAKAFSLSFIPTSTDGEKQIQVDTVTIEYYPYVESFVTIQDPNYPTDPTKQITYTYYELSSEPTEMTVYDFSENGAMTDKKSDEIRLDSKNMTTAGKYIITRTYKVDGGYSYNDNDYYQRTYIFTVDRNDVITSAELTKQNPHLESLVGGDIFLSMYDTKEDASLVVTFPNSEDGNTDGSSLYNNGSMATPRTVLTTNKMPLRLYIPQFKYTTYVSPIKDSGKYNFDVNYNFKQINGGILTIDPTDNTNQDIMNYFNETLLIPEYILSANIYKDKIDPRNLFATANPMVTRVDAEGNNYMAYDSNKTSRGFLNFEKTDGSSLEHLSESGIYYVELMQGRFGIEVAENKYEQKIIFAFEIKDVAPDFTAQEITGSPLTSEVNKNGFNEIYYTNQPNLTLIWNAGSKYMAEIDIPEITLKMSNKPAPIHAATVDESTGEYVYENIFVDTPKLSGKQYVCQISLEKLGIYSHDAYVDIQMQYKNHNDTFYSVVKKRIKVDLSAPSDNINQLVNKSVKDSKISALNSNSLRSYYTAKMEQTKLPTNTSYNVSNNTGTFAYYSYAVTRDYLSTLQASIGSSSDTYHIYTRKFADLAGNSTKYQANEEQETAPANFLPTNNFTAIAENGSISKSTFSFDTNSYYEIIEVDKAGNMSIYTIYITNYQETVSDIKGYNNLITYTSTDPDGRPQTNHYTIADYNLVKNHTGAIHNIYSKTGFQLQSLNYFGDEWAQFTLDSIDAAGFKTTYNLLLTPWDKDYAYAFVGQTYTKILISDLIDGSVSSRFKNSVTFYNRENSSYESFYFNIRNTTLSSSLTDKQDEEYIRFAQPNDVSIQSTTYGTTYLTSLKITTNKDIQPIYEQTNKLGYARSWSSNEKITVLYDSNTDMLTFKLNPSYNFDTNTKIIYTYKDNFGNEYKQIHIYKEPIINKIIDSQKDLYAYYDTNTGNLKYITENGLKYSYNPAKYDIKVFEVSSGMISNLEVLETETFEAGGYDPTKTSEKATWGETSQGGYTTKTIVHAEAGAAPDLLTDNYNNTFAICVYNKDDATLIQTIYFTLYRELPKANLEDRINQRGEFRIDDANNNNITANIINDNPSSSKGYFSEIRLSYLLKEDPFIPVHYSISTDKVNWRALANGEILKCTTASIEKYYLKVWYDEEYIKNEIGASNYIFGLVDSAQIYEFNLSALTQTYWVEQVKNGQTYIVEKSNKIYRTSSGTQYSNHYILNINYSDKSDNPIKTNEELKISTILLESFEDGAGVVSDLWWVSNEGAAGLGNIPEFSTYVVLSYIPTTNNFVEEFFISNADGLVNDSENLVNLTSEKGNITKSIVINENSTVDQLELRWTKFYGIPQNEINISIVKDGIELFPNVYSRSVGEKQYNYVRLNHSGKYQIKFYDSSTPANIQKFNRGKAGQTDTFNIIFLKDVPFTVNYTNPVTGETEISLPINEAVYNGSVTLKIDKSTRPEFYASSGYPSISVKRNGVDYTETFSDDTTYIFDKPGYYEVSFSAVSNLPEIGNIRKQTYRFTILNANEYRYSYIYNRFSNYYIEKVEKNGIDITDTLTETLDVSTMTINDKVYLTELPLSYLDEKTGNGSYLITVNSNDKLLKESSAITKYTFKVVIEVGTAPIKVSLAEGKTTTSKINVTYNLANIYREMGECNFRIIRYGDEKTTTVYSKEILNTSSGEEVQTIEDAGTYYIQILSPSGNLLYSYKVVKQNPLNTAAIIAIIISVAVVVLAIILVVKLRKRISVK